jgi:hypothetical protein
MRSEVAAPMQTARAVLFSFWSSIFGLRSAAGELRDAVDFRLGWPILRI